MKLKTYSNDIQDTVVLSLNQKSNNMTIISWSNILRTFESSRHWSGTSLWVFCVIHWSAWRWETDGSWSRPMRKSFIQWMPSISWSKPPFDYFNCMLPQFQAVQVPVPWDLTVHFRGNSSLTKDLLPFSAWAKTVLDLPLFWSTLATLDQHVNIKICTSSRKNL